MNTNKRNLTIWFIFIAIYIVILVLWYLFCKVWPILPDWLCPECVMTWDWTNWTFWCCILSFLLIAFLPLMLSERIKEVVVDAETVKYLIKKNKLRKFKKYHMLTEELSKVSLDKVLKKCRIAPIDQDKVCTTKKCKKCEFVEHKLTPERIAEAAKLVKKYKVKPAKAKTAMLSEMLEIKIYEPKEKKNKK